MSPGLPGAVRHGGRIHLRGLRARCASASRPARPPHVFASADMAHPQRCWPMPGCGGPVALFARNRPVRAGPARSSTSTPPRCSTLLLDDTCPLGTSTPEADPSGDYAWSCSRGERLRPGRVRDLDAKALQLTGAPTAEAPEGRNAYAWLMEQDRADLFLTYCTNAVLAQRRCRAAIVAAGGALGRADYGLRCQDAARRGGSRSSSCRPTAAILARYGFLRRAAAGARCACSPWLWPWRARARAAGRAERMVTDSAGREVAVPDRIERVFAAGPPASVLLYVLAPDRMIGWPRAPHAEELPYIAPEYRDLPEVGWLTGRGDTRQSRGAAAVQARPDPRLRLGARHLRLARRAGAGADRHSLHPDRRPVREHRRGAAPARRGARRRGAGRAARAPTSRAPSPRSTPRSPRCRRTSGRGSISRAGPDGLETGLQGSINTEIIERVGAVNVAVDPSGARRGIAQVPLEQVLVWNPDTVITWDRRLLRGRLAGLLLAGRRLRSQTAGSI